MFTYESDASIDLFMFVVEPEWVLCIVLDLSLKVRSSLSVIKIFWPKVFIVFSLINWHVSSLWEID